MLSGQNVPENSLSAFSFAVERKATAIELDCRLSKDGKLVVMHDKNVDRTMHGSGYVNKLTIGAWWNTDVKLV